MSDSGWRIYALVGRVFVLCASLWCLATFGLGQSTPEPNREAARQRFISQGAPQSPAPDISNAASDAARLSESSEFQRAREYTDRRLSGDVPTFVTDVLRSFQDLLNRIGEAIRDAIRWILERLFQRPIGGGSGEASAIGNAIIYSVIAILLGLALFLIVRAIRSGQIARAKKLAGGLLEEEEEFLRADEWRERAQSLLAQGRAREAIRCLYLASLARLDEANVLEFRRNETNWEHQRRLKRLGERARGISIDEITRRFDFVWYGHEVRLPEDYELFLAAYDNLKERLKQAA